MPRTSSEILSQEFLLARAKILEIAAFFDRLDAPSQGAIPEGTAQRRQHDLLRAACQIVTDDQADKAARMQLLFSREYNPHWRDEFGI